ncbi:Membrane protein involved in the export of O-antigen and teichoic acid [Fodinibius roseus]|uniref:Membrane protein involved in the export of O-antigen and teichoic acid n=1 Tax=Fodinibius roseus TaxID=1194090 RepID=A0A1M4W312_9BACT|nr:polysaccharide biosynthesis C-terminal domain-containing protein [Fodinibius roseus]SHE75589.1 Membrane protein involved in the export of O-antigen and teichoic acid [Fodinibius roseus]
MKKLKELLSDTLVYGISSVLARFIGYLLVPLHTSGVFETSEYGIVSLVYAGLAFLNVIFTFGMESAYLRYAKDRDLAKDVFKTLQTGLAGLSSILVLLLILAAPFLMPTMNLEASGNQNLYWMMLGILWFDTMVLIPFAELRLVQRQWLFAIIKTGNILINVGLQFYLILGLNWGIQAVFFASLVASGLTAVVLWIVTADMFSGSWDTPVLRKALWFGLPFVPAGLGFVINETLDRFFLGNYLSQSTVAKLYSADLIPADIVGIYSASYKVSVFMLLLVQMFRMAWQPFFLRESDDPEAPKTYRDVFRYFNVVAAICFLVVALFVQQIVQIRVPLLDAYLVGEEYWMGLHIVPVLLGAYWFHGWYMNFSAGIFIEEKTKVLPVITLIGAGVTIAVNLVLIPYYGMMGSAVATLVSYAAMALLLYYQSIKIYPVNYQIHRAFGMMLLAVLCWYFQPYLTYWIPGEWMSRTIMLIIGIAGFLWLSRPTGEK